MIGKYNRIDKVVCEEGYETYLVTDETESHEVDVKSDFWFNELKILERKTIKTIHSLNELFNFLEQYKIDYDDRLYYGELRVGGEADMIVNKDLEYQWM